MPLKQKALVARPLIRHNGEDQKSRFMRLFFGRPKVMRWEIIWDFIF